MRTFAKIKTVIKFISKWGRPPRYFRGNYSPDELGSLVESAGFKIEEVDLIGDQMKALYLRAIKK
jgi:hypothetical protein